MIRHIIIALLGFAFGVCVTSAILHWTVCKTPHPYQVTDKDEFGGRCYVQTWIEVTPEEYIGLEVGDEFEVRE